MGKMTDELAIFEISKQSYDLKSPNFWLICLSSIKFGNGLGHVQFSKS